MPFDHASKLEMSIFFSERKGHCMNGPKEKKWRGRIENFWENKFCLSVLFHLEIHDFQLEVGTLYKYDVWYHLIRKYILYILIYYFTLYFLVREIKKIIFLQINKTFFQQKNKIHDKYIRKIFFNTKEYLRKNST